MEEKRSNGVLNMLSRSGVLMRALGEKQESTFWEKMGWSKDTPEKEHPQAKTKSPESAALQGELNLKESRAHLIRVKDFCILVSFLT